MSRTKYWMSLLLFLSCLSPSPAAAQNAGDDSMPDWKAGTDGWCEYTVSSNHRNRTQKVVEENLIVIDHSRNRVVCPRATPLRVREGRYVRTVFLRTHPNSFSYRVSAIEAPTPRTAGATTGPEQIPVPLKELTSTFLTLRHDRHISQYTIDITPVAGKEVEVGPSAEERQAVQREVMSSLSRDLRAAAPRELQNAAEDITNRAYRIGPSRPELEEMVEEEVTEIPSSRQAEIESLSQEVAENLKEEVEQITLRPFQVIIEVETAGPELTFTSGFAFSDLINPRFFLAPDTKGTPATEDDVVNVQEDDRGRDVEPDVMALINMRWPDLKHRFLNKVGVAFGLGLNGDNEPRYFLGPSFTLPKGFVFTAGFSGGDVKVLPAGQGVNRPLVNGATTLPSLDTDFKVGFHVGISFTFTDRENDVASHLNSLTVIQSPAPTTPSGEEGEEGDDDDEEEEEEENEEGDDGSNGN